MRTTLTVMVIVNFLCVGCASIFNGIGPDPISIQSSPPGAKCNVRERDSNFDIASIVTPNIVMLKKKRGYFQPAHYKILCSLQENETREAAVSSTLSPWWFGNILIGGALGMLIIDPATGGMWSLSPETVMIDYDGMGKAMMEQNTAPQEVDASVGTPLSSPDKSPF